MYKNKKAADILRAIGMHPRYKGYAYILCMLDVISSSPTKAHNLTADLYPVVMSRFNVSRAAVERGMRYAIEKTWANGNVDDLQRIFSAYKTGWVPTNCEFIAVLTECMHCKRLSKSNNKLG